MRLDSVTKPECSVAESACCGDPWCRAPAMPPAFPAEMPDQPIVIWTPVRLLMAVFRAIATPELPAQFAPRTDDGA